MPFLSVSEEKLAEMFPYGWMVDRRDRLTPVIRKDYEYGVFAWPLSIGHEADNPDRSVSAVLHFAGEDVASYDSQFTFFRLAIMPNPASGFIPPTQSEFTWNVSRHSVGSNTTHKVEQERTAL